MEQEQTLEQETEQTVEQEKEQTLEHWTQQQEMEHWTLEQQTPRQLGTSGAGSSQQPLPGTSGEKP